jgi:GTP-binding protein
VEKEVGIIMKRSMVVSLIGRPNVGKSSIFNRLMRRSNKAITFDKPGVTRDRHYGIARFDELHDEKEVETILVDTGGFYPEKIDTSAPKVEDENFNKFFNIMTNHAEIAISESDLVLFVVDVREGIIPFDEQIAKYIRSTKKEFWLIINKFDSESQCGTEAEFYSLGIDPDKMFTVSASHGYGMTDVQRKIQEHALQFENSNCALTPDLQKGVTPREDVVSKIAIIGAPNAGKSTLLNQLLDSERALVSNIAGTTVDPIEGFFDLYFGQNAKDIELDSHLKSDSKLFTQQYEEFKKNNSNVFKIMMDSYEAEGGDFEKFSTGQETAPTEVEEVVAPDENKDGLDRAYNQLFVDKVEPLEDEKEEGSFWRSIHIVDTAGIRKQSVVHGFIESQSVFRALRCITEAEIVIFMIDSTKGINHQDRRLMDIANEKGKSIIVCMNKMDLIKDKVKDDRARKEWLEDVRYDIPWLSHCDLVPMSAKFGKQMKNLKKVLVKSIMIRRRKVPTGELNRFVYGLVDKNPVVLKRANGKRFKVKYVSQLKTSPPTFLFFSNMSQGIPDNYRKYIQNNLRSEFGLDNCPVHLIFRTGKELEKRLKKVKQ